jgi:dimethylaniline monooxygenase (N-oxide forming)
MQTYALKAGLLNRIKFNIRVSEVRREDSGWQVSTDDGQVFTCEKLIIATGMYSTPNWPNIPNKGFKGPVMHSVSLGPGHHRLTAPEIESVAILGGCKSSIETANICLNAGKKVYWVMRENGSGAGTIILFSQKSRAIVGSINNSRLFTTLSPSIFNARGFWYQFFHSGKWKWGVAFLKKFWAVSTSAINDWIEYEKSSNGQKIRPEISEEGLVIVKSYDHNALMLFSLFWLTTSVSAIASDGYFLPILHQEKQLLVHRANPLFLPEKGMHLSDGTLLPVSAVVYATGWTQTESLFSSSETLDLGLPVPLADEPSATAVHWDDLNAVADAQVCRLFPRLTSPPSHFIKQPSHAPHRLYRYII